MNNPDPKADGEFCDIEEMSRKGEVPSSQARRFRIRIDKEHFVVDQPDMSGRQILALVKKEPVRFKLVQRLRGGQTRVIKPDEVVDFRAPGIERFHVMAVDQTEGESPRRDFNFTADDTEFLDGLGLVWSTVVDGGSRWLIIRDYALPAGYTQARVDIAVQIVPGFPDAQLDMVFVHPALRRIDGKEIRATQTMQAIAGRSFQRWSRHRTVANPWRPGVDSIVTHMALVDDWFAREFK